MPRIKKDTNQILIETMVQRSLRDIACSPERTIRNLVDLALNFSHGRFQRNFLETAQAMLKNKKSAYYDLLKDAIASIDHRTISTFGINMGYNSCTKGAKTIRATEATDSFSIPWSLTFSVNEASWKAHADRYASAIEEGKELGIFTYLFFLSGELPGFLDLAISNPDCAFLFFCSPEDLTDERISALLSIHNIMISVDTTKNYETVCQKLRKNKLLYACHHFYTPDDCDFLFSGNWLKNLRALKPSFLFIYPLSSAASQIPAKTLEDVYDYVKDLRSQQCYPAFLLDLFSDNMVIDRIISDHAHVALFLPNGDFFAFSDEFQQIPCKENLFDSSLSEIFSTVLTHR